MGLPVAISFGPELWKKKIPCRGVKGVNWIGWIPRWMKMAGNH